METIENVTIRFAEENDLTIIKDMFDSEKDVFSFITRGTIIDAIEKNEIIVAVLNGGVIGFLHYYHRKRDLQTTLYHLIVNEEFRRKGVGTMLYDAILTESTDLGRDFLQLKCPVNEDSNIFHRDYGFMLSSVEKGKRRELNVWKLRINKR